MGVFSWHAQDTGRAIVMNGIEDHPTFPVTMTDDKGNRWTETNYNGYGVFGGKDYYELLAEMNGFGSNRFIGVEVWCARYRCKNCSPKIIFPNLSEDPNWTWNFRTRPWDDVSQGGLCWDEIKVMAEPLGLRDDVTEYISGGLQGMPLRHCHKCWRKEGPYIMERRIRKLERKAQSRRGACILM